MVGVVFLCVSLWQSSHVHHQHGSEDAEHTCRHISFVFGLFSDGHPGDAEPHGEHSHDVPDKTTHAYKQQTGGKTLRDQADFGNKLKIFAVFCSRHTAVLTAKDSTNQALHVMGSSGAWLDARPPARAPPTSSSLA